MADSDWLIGCVNELHIEPGTPGCIRRAHGIRVPTVSPVLGGVVPDIGQACGESILRSDGSDGYVKGFPRKQFFRATRKPFEAEAALLQRVELAG